MTNRTRLEEDFSYVRRALERQRRLVHEYIPVWLAAVMGLFFITTFSMKDLVAMGYLAQTTREWVGNLGFIAFMAALLFQGWRRRGRCGTAGLVDKDQKIRYYAFLIGPWLIYLGGVVLLYFAADSLNLDKNMWRPFALVYTGISFALIGLNRLNIILWFGYGILAATTAMVFLPMPFPFTVLGLTTAAGLVFGAWRDQRVVKRLSANG